MRGRQPGDGAKPAIEQGLRRRVHRAVGVRKSDGRERRGEREGAKKIPGESRRDETFCNVCTVIDSQSDSPISQKSFCYIQRTCISACRGGNRCTSCRCVSACRGGRGCTPRTCVSACRGGSRRTPRTSFSACREGRGCTPRKCISLCRGGRGCTPLRIVSARLAGKGCTPRSCFWTSREGRGCTPRKRVSACRGGRGCTPHTCFSAFLASTVSVPSRLVYDGIAGITRSVTCGYRVAAHIHHGCVVAYEASGRSTTDESARA